MILSTPEGFVYDMRAASDARIESRRQIVDVVTEEDWFRWMLTQHAPSSAKYPVGLVWVES